MKFTNTNRHYDVTCWNCGIEYNINSFRKCPDCSAYRGDDPILHRDNPNGYTPSNTNTYPTDIKLNRRPLTRRRRIPIEPAFELEDDTLLPEDPNPTTFSNDSTREFTVSEIVINSSEIVDEMIQSTNYTHSVQQNMSEQLGISQETERRYEDTGEGVEGFFSDLDEDGEPTEAQQIRIEENCTATPRESPTEDNLPF